MENVNETNSTETEFSGENQKEMEQQTTAAPEILTTDKVTPQAQEESVKETESVQAKEPEQEPVLIPETEPVLTHDVTLPVNESANSTDIEENQPLTEEHQEELEAEPLENFSLLNKEQLVARLQELVEVPEFNSVKSKVNAVRDVFHHIISEERASALSKFLEDGGLKEEFDGTHLEPH